MKFLRYCLDLSEDDALTLNEKSLAKGRSLKRPQNKGVDNGADDYEKYKNYIVGLKKQSELLDKRFELLVKVMGLEDSDLTE